MKLSPRLRCIADSVPPHARFADVGTDHARLPIWLLQRGRIRGAVVSDIRDGPLKRARENARRYGLEGSISFRLCDGLAGIGVDEADTIAIAGMGGETIARILGASPWVREGKHLLLLHPMSSIPELRKWLQENNFSIQRAYLAAENGRYYVIMRVRTGEMPVLRPGECYAGRQWEGMGEPLRLAYLEDCARRVRRALEGMSQSALPGRGERRGELEDIRQDLEKMIKEWQAWQA